MSLHRSLKTKPAGLNQHRNVLNRAERIDKLKGDDQFEDGTTSPMGLPKVGSRKVKLAGKKKAADEGEGEGDGEGEATETAAE